MKFVVILGNNQKINTDIADDARAGYMGFLHIKIKDMPPDQIYAMFLNPEATKEIKVVSFTDKYTIVEDEHGKKKIEHTLEQNPLVKYFYNYAEIYSLEKVLEEENAWFIKLISYNPKEKIVPEIYEDDEDTAE